MDRLADAQAHRLASLLLTKTQPERRSRRLGWIVGASAVVGLLAAIAIYSEVSLHVSMASGSSSVGSPNNQEKDMRDFDFKQLLSAVVLSGAVSATAMGQAPVEWKVSDGGNGHWYQWVKQPSGITWSSAQSLCEAKGGYLATPTSSAENDFVFNLTLPTSEWPTVLGPWLGGFQAPNSIEPGGGWQWVTGEPWTWTIWDNGQPDNGCESQNESSLHYLWFFKHWNDFPNNAPGCGGWPLNWSFIIEWSADCNSDNIVDYGQILLGQLLDTNTNGIPDICEVDPCPGDIVQNNTVDGVDLAVILSVWGTSGSEYPRADTNHDGIVSGPDLAVVLGAWGPCP